MAATLSEIAEQAEVSAMTVSRVLNGRKTAIVATSTKERIIKIAEQLGYNPNINARALASKRSLLIGVLFNDVNFLSATQFLSGVQEECISHEYAPILLSHQNERVEAMNLRLCLRRDVDALIINPFIDAQLGADGSDSPAQHYTELLESGLPIVEVFGRKSPQAPSVRYDHFAEGRIATSQLLKRGHRRIVLFTHAWYRRAAEIPSLCFDAHEQWQGFMAEMNRCGAEPIVVAHPLASQPVLSEGPMPFFNAAMGVVDQIFEHPAAPTAVVCYSIYQAMAVLTAARARAVDIPARFSVVAGGNDTRLLWPIGPRPASIIRDPAAVGRIAVQAALARIQGLAVADSLVQPTFDAGETMVEVEKAFGSPVVSMGPNAASSIKNSPAAAVTGEAAVHESAGREVSGK